MTPRDGLPGPSVFLTAQRGPCPRPLSVGSLYDRDQVATGRAPGEKAQLDESASNGSPIEANTACRGGKQQKKRHETGVVSRVPSSFRTLRCSGRTETLTGLAGHTSSMQGSKKGATNGERVEGDGICSRDRTAGLSTAKVCIPRKSITDSTVMSISRSTAKRSVVPRQFDQLARCLASREGGRYLAWSV